MRKLLTIFVLLALLLGLSACSKVPAGHVGVKVYLLGTSKGVDTEELGTGRYWIGWNEELYLFPTFTQNYVWTASKDEGSPNDESITFQTKEGMSVNADIGIAYHIEPTKVNTVFQKYRKGVEEITDINLRNYVRDAFNTAASSKPVESVYGTGKNELIAEVEGIVENQVCSYGIVVEKISVIGSFRLPQQVVQALNRKIEATQRAEQRENELREAEAEAKKKIAIAQGDAESTLTKAEAEAKANKIISASLTSNLIEYRRIDKWDGKVPQVTSGGTPFLNLK